MPLVLLGGLLLVLLVLAANAGAKLVKGHRYKLTFSTPTLQRAGASVADLDGLTSALGTLGWSGVFLEPLASDPPSVWRAAGVWTGQFPSLKNGNGVQFIGDPVEAGAAVDPNAPHPFDANLPPDLESAFLNMIANDVDVNELLEASDAALRAGYPIASQALAARAHALQAMPNPPSPPPPPPPPAPSPPNVPVPVPMPIPVPNPPGPAPQPPAPPAPAPVQGFGTDATSWDPTWSVPDARPDAATVYAGYGHSTRFTNSVVDALNLWAQQVGFDSDGALGLFPATYGYGPHVAALVAAFEFWLDQTQGADYAAIGMPWGGQLGVDGILGPETLPWLAAWNPSGIRE